MTIYPTYKLGDVAEYINGRAFKPKEWKEKGLPIVRIQNLNDENAEYHYSDVMHEDKYLLHNGDLLFAWAASLGTYIWDKGDAWLNQHIFKVIPKENVSKKYLYYALTSIIKELYAKSHGSGMVHVTKDKFVNTEIPLPPLPTQHAIVSRIESLFAKLDKAVEHLRTAQQQLKIYRQAVLNKFLTDGSENWGKVKLGNVAEIKRGRSKHRPRNDKSLFGGKYPFIQTGEIREANGGIITKYTQTYSEKGLEQSRLWPKGTLCLTIAANIAETAYLGFDACFPDSVVGIIAKKDVLDLDYFNKYIQLIKQIIENQASATAQKNINVEYLENLEIPLPPLSDQQRIVEEIETRLSQAEAAEVCIAESLQKTEALRQSILKKAFSGELVSTLQ